MGDKLISINPVEGIVGYKKSKIYELIAEGHFPKPIKLGPRCSRWSYNQVQEWVEKTIAGNRDV